MSVALVQPIIVHVSFGEFWEKYPRKIARKAAVQAWNKLSEANQRLAIDTIHDHIKAWRLEGREARLIPHASTWLNGERFLDEIEIPKPVGPPQVGVCGHSLSSGSTMTSKGLVCGDCWSKR